MLGRLWPRFALEAFFLVAVALVAGLLNLSVAEVIVVMAVAYLLTVVVELVSWRARRSGHAVVAEAPVEDVPVHEPSSVVVAVRAGDRPPRPEEDETWLDQLAPAAPEPEPEPEAEAEAEAEVVEPEPQPEPEPEPSPTAEPQPAEPQAEEPEPETEPEPVAAAPQLVVGAGARARAGTRRTRAGTRARGRRHPDRDVASARAGAGVEPVGARAPESRAGR